MVSGGLAHQADTNRLEAGEAKDYPRHQVRPLGLQLGMDISQAISREQDASSQ